MKTLLRAVLPICIVLAWFNWGIEEFRLGNLGDIPQHPLSLFSPPWLPLRAYASRNGDEKLFWQYSKLTLGEAPDLDYLASKKQGNAEQNRIDIEKQISTKPGLRLPYRDFPFEYPPVALVPMLIPRAFVDALPEYRVAYGIVVSILTLMACAFAAMLCRDLGPFAPEKPWKRMTLLILAIGPLLVSRFDILPAMLVTLALLLLARNRSFGAGIAIGVATLTKLYPIFLLLPWGAQLWFSNERRKAIHLIVGAALAAVIISAPFLWITPGPFLQSLFVYGARPFQIESLIGAISVLVGGKDVIIGSFGSYNVTAAAFALGPWSLLLWIAVSVCAILAALQARNRPAISHETFVQRLTLWTLTVICFILLTSKVLSPQFLIWLIPLLAITPGKAIFRCGIGTFVLTQGFYPYLYDFLINGSRLVALLVVMRNIVLVFITLFTLRAAVSLLQNVINHEPISRR